MEREEKTRRRKGKMYAYQKQEKGYVQESKNKAKEENMTERNGTILNSIA
jgi:GTP cyclohydrolase II